MNEINESHENSSEAEQNEKLLKQKLEAATVVIFGDEAGEHLEFMHDLDAEAAINYLYGVLLVSGYDPEELLEATGILDESSDES